MGYAPGLALGRRSVRSVSCWRLWELSGLKQLQVLLDDLLELWPVGRHILHHLVLYMYAMMMQD
jgi:hypothetical protein